ncbi:sulfite exporter TauE/SafE family protein 3-like isoform X1 [Rhododendron vialii]|uniref:sulfite exporter TauE/SafE family protein 3-like isoform X1 n=1 Tax=Rhododendron vialii TaxID=182163 RepID=UPI0026600986|nr:sulfite exporter TauE/SafE family protein 3-like isoform X1 [Rhododendron vialii]
MGEIGLRGKLLSSAVVAVLGLSSVLFVSNQWSTLKLVFSSSEGRNGGDVEPNHIAKLLNLVWREAQLGYEHVWPEMEFGWKIVVGTVIGFFGAAFGSVGGVGGGGIFVPMLTLIIGFDAKSSTAMSKCMITGASAASVFYNIKLRHPTLELPIIDYDLALLFQPMLVLGISIGVMFNVIFADWMVTVLLIILFLGTSTKAFFKGVETWKKETIVKKEAARRLASIGESGVDSEEVEYKPLPEGPNNGTQMESSESKASTVSIIENVHWKELGILVSVWVTILALQIAKSETTTCSAAYWVLNLLQIPVAFGASAYEAIGLYKGRRVIASKGDVGMAWRIHQLVLYCFIGILAGVVGGLLGLGGGFILGPLFLELGIPPQVSSATATFAMLFSSSMSVVEYYILKRFPVPYSLYFVAVATVAAFTGQHVVRRIVAILGRASLIIFILAFTIFVSAISLGGVGISNIIEDIEEKEYMGFEDICSY